jgi:hypothetical protein
MNNSFFMAIIVYTYAPWQVEDSTSGDLAMADHFAELALGDQQAWADPALNPIARSPAFHIAADGLDNRERGFDDVGTAQGGER